MNAKGLVSTIALAATCSLAQASPVTEQMNLLTMLEATTTSLTTLGAYSVLNPLGETNGTALLGPAGLSWSGSYSADGWSYSASGMLGGAALSLSYTGRLQGAEGGDISVVFSATGQLGLQPILMNGATLWHFDAAADDYLEMDFSQEAKIEANSRWNWTKGREVVKCAGDGIVTDLITGGLILVAESSSGKKSDIGSGLRHCVKDLTPFRRHGSLTVSVISSTAFTADRQVAPAAPPRPQESDLLNPANQGSLFTDDGRLFADDASNRFRSSGVWTAGIRGSGGTLEGDTFNVAEPGGMALQLLALAGLACALRTRRRGG